MEGSNMSHFSFMHCGEKEVNLAQCSEHKKVQTLLPISGRMLQPAALRQRHSLLSTAPWSPSVSGTKAGQHNLQSRSENTYLGQAGRGG